VSVFVIDCTTIGCPDPTGMPPTSTVLVGRRRGVAIDGMVERAPVIGTRRARPAGVSERVAVDAAWDRGVWIVEDEPAAATLAADLCEQVGASPTVYRSPLPFLAALRSSPPPVAVVFDWRLEHELSAALFLATRHRYPHLAVIYWTGSPAEQLPAMIRDDQQARIVDKASGTAAFEAALAWAFEGDEA
jgi:CheY-like chemotaxis protein